MSTENDKKLQEQLKSGFKRTIKWNNYRSQMTIQSNNNNLNYLIDPIFTKVHIPSNFKEAYVYFIFILINTQYVLRLRISNFAETNCSSHR